jgi:ER lumen protein retaining receptor
MAPLKIHHPTPLMTATLALSKMFRFVGDLLHVASKYVLVSKIEKTKSCSGLSLKTQFLYALVFMCRYLDLFELRFKKLGLEELLDVYNSIMKVLFIGFQLMVLYFMRIRFFSTYDRKWDKFNITVILVPCFLISIVVAWTTGPFLASNILYVFSILLESVAILPQLVQLEEAGESETMTSQYICLLGLYRTCYTLYFILKKLGGAKVGNILIACGMLQTLLYADFFLLYYKYVFSSSGEAMGLPKLDIKRDL